MADPKDDEFRADYIAEARTFVTPDPKLVVWRVKTQAGDEFNFIIAPKDLGRLGKQMQADARLMEA